MDPLTQNQPPSPPHHSHVAFWIGSAIALLVALGLGIGLWFTSGHLLSDALSFMHPATQQGGIVTLRSARDNVRYTRSGSTLTPLQNPAAPTQTAVFIHEQASTVGANTPVLASPSSLGPARIVALLNGSQLAVLASSFEEKRDVVARPDGLIAYSAFEEGAATTTGSFWDLFVINPATSTPPADVGPGVNPVFLPDGNMLAFSPDGLVEVNPVLGARNLRAGAPYAGTAAASLISPTGSYAVLPNSITHGADVFLIDPAQTMNLTYVGSVPAQPDALGALDGNTFIAQTGQTATAYTVSASGLTAGATFTIAH